jgi:hypothetical protein
MVAAAPMVMRRMVGRQALAVAAARPPLRRTRLRVARGEKGQDVEQEAEVGEVVVAADVEDVGKVDVGYEDEKSREAREPAPEEEPEQRQDEVEPVGQELKDVLEVLHADVGRACQELTRALDVEGVGYGVAEVREPEEREPGDERGEDEGPPEEASVAPAGDDAAEPDEAEEEDRVGSREE